ncbi:hypothetical protein [Escherichia coli]|nr:hypothetical protein [Escherichia coli]
MARGMPSLASKRTTTFAQTSGMTLAESSRQGCEGCEMATDFTA